MKIYQELEMKSRKLIFELGVKRFLLLEMFIFPAILVFLNEIYPFNFGLDILILKMVGGVVMNFVCLFYFQNEYMKKGTYKRKDLGW